MGIEMFATHFPAIGRPERIWLAESADDNTTLYTIKFPEDLSEANIERISQFVQRNGGIRDAVAGDTRRTVTVRSKAVDSEHHILEWLQGSFWPVHRYVAVADVFLAATPIAASLDIIGAEPSDSLVKSLLDSFRALPDIQAIHYDPPTKMFIIIFTPDALPSQIEATLNEALRTQEGVSVTIRNDTDKRAMEVAEQLLGKIVRQAE
jgi:hypothetical protein